MRTEEEGDLLCVALFVTNAFNFKFLDIICSCLGGYVILAFVPVHLLQPPADVCQLLFHLLPLELELLDLTGLALDGDLVLRDSGHAALVLPDHIRQLVLVLLKLGAEVALLPRHLGSLVLRNLPAPGHVLKLGLEVIHFQLLALFGLHSRGSVILSLLQLEKISVNDHHAQN